MKNLSLIFIGLISIFGFSTQNAMTKYAAKETAPTSEHLAKKECCKSCKNNNCTSKQCESKNCTPCGDEGIICKTWTTVRNWVTGLFCKPAHHETSAAHVEKQEGCCDNCDSDDECIPFKEQK